MPQLFYFIKELNLVDWETIVVYTCINPKCIPEFAADQYYLKEVAYIQFSEDFSKVQYSDTKSTKKQELGKIKEEEEKQVTESKDKKKKNKKKNKKGE